jgi:prephenate dehydrogenase
MKTPKVISIIGGTGKMGSLFAPLFKKENVEVIISGRNTAYSYEEAAKLGDIVIVIVPINAFGSVIKKIGKHVKKDSLLTDFTSIKEMPVRLMKKYSKAEVLGGHPLFGPQIQNMENQNFILVNGRGNTYVDWYKNFLEKQGLNVSHFKPKEHDEKMALTQALPYFTLFIFGEFLKKNKVTFTEIKNILTPNSKTLYSLFVRVASQDDRMNRDILIENEHFRNTVKDFSEITTNLAKNIENYEREKIGEITKELKKQYKDEEMINSQKFIVKCLQNKYKIKEIMGWE